MLATLLPGLRDLRAPLSAGFVWLLALWIGFQPLLPSERNATGAWASLLALKEAVTPAGATAAIAFAAYLLGSVSEGLLSALRRGGRRADNEQYLRLGETGNEALRDAIENALADVDPKGVGELVDGLLQSGVAYRKAQLVRIFEDPFDAAYYQVARRIDPQFDGNLDAARNLLAEHPSEVPYFTNVLLSEVREQLSRAVLQEAEQLRTRLLGKEPEIFSKVDRLRAEAEFRAAIAFPLVGLGSALLWRADWWTAGVVWLAAAVLVWQGRTRRQQSDDTLIEALRVERVTSPTLERVRALVHPLVTSDVSGKEAIRRQ